MTANNFVASRKHNRVFIATDAASYLDDGTITEFKSKIRAIPEWPAVITGRGNAFGLGIAARELQKRAANFDELVGIASRELPLIVEQFRLDRPFELSLAGFFRGRPMVFFIRTPGDHNSMGDWPPYLICPVAVNSTACCPRPSDELIAASGYIEPKPDDEPEAIERGLRKLLELQRRTLAEDSFPRVGGWADLTTISPDGIEQRTFHHWPEDRVGHRLSIGNREH
ncbi:hypothetical protein LPJ38_26800 [Bradyrhizobium daqingense]|uniref:Uncharacterized protein n=1 Tax=Bradyrhizobium daqingense TaxID=993502 RepID=A0A562LMK4_9BRAD|nr:hypothetical protein [Bradyrhizobium daqingense]TWI08852.1 hypothetical protein IQ17_01676 [Bradyrhizobium daqingense]UFS87238.1 hypothetical protein LPJ38_26800 [Bradyrhizobium daqingense]